MRYDGNQFDTSSRRSPSHVERSSFPLDVAEDSELAEALRGREDVFNDDILPPDAELRAPRDFYAATATGPSRCRKHGQTRIRDDKGATRFPYLAA